jgi:DNA-binding LacI/PurR family transcriptional regulator
VDGVVAMEVHWNDKRIDLLREMEFPFSMSGRCADLSGICYVDIDFDQTTKEAVDFLVSQGHRRIAFINHSQSEYDAGYGPAVRAKTGFDAAARGAGINNLSRTCHAAPAAGYEVLGSLPNEEPDLTAILTMNERAIPGILQGIAERGWSIPDDFSLLAIVTSARAAEMVRPSLTTMEPPGAKMARLGVELLIKRLEGETAEAAQVLLPCRLVIRGSTGPCRPAKGAADG